MSEEILMGDRPYKPAPLSPRQKAAEFRVIGKSGGVITGEFVDGAEKASYSIAWRPGETLGPGIRLFIRSEIDFNAAAKVMRVMAAKLEELA